MVVKGVRMVQQTHISIMRKCPEPCPIPHLRQLVCQIGQADGPPSKTFISNYGKSRGEAAKTNFVSHFTSLLTLGSSCNQLHDFKSSTCILPADCIPRALLQLPTRGLCLLLLRSIFADPHRFVPLLMLRGAYPTSSEGCQSISFFNIAGHAAMKAFY